MVNISRLLKQIKIKKNLLEKGGFFLYVLTKLNYYNFETNLVNFDFKFEALLL